MDRLLRKLYYDPKTGFVSATKLYKKAKEINSSITQKYVREWYKAQPLNQQFSNQTRQFPDFKIASRNPNEWQMDLAFWKKQPILITVNINSRIGYAKLLPNKRAPTVQKAIDQFITEHSVSAVMSDNGSEFTNNSVERFLDKNEITHANAIAGDHTVLGKIDRFIRTIKARLTKMQEVSGFNKLTQRILNDAIDNYNNTEHSAIKAKPNEMEGRVIESEVEHNKKLVKKVEEGIPVGSSVRYKLIQKQFSKEGARYSKTVYEVVGLDGLKMKIKSKNGQVLFKPVNDLKMVRAEPSNAPIEDNQLIEVDRLLDHEKVGTKYKYLVKWKGDHGTSWEPQANLRLVNKNRMSDVEKEYWSRVDQN